MGANPFDAAGGLDPALVPANPYLLLTPGPLSTSSGVRAALVRDWCTWDEDYNRMVQWIRERLVAVATAEPGYTGVLMQGSGSFAVEAVLGSAVPEGGVLLVIANGHYGERMARMAERLRLDLRVLNKGETGRPTEDEVAELLRLTPEVTHVAVVHCETTTGMLNPVERIVPVVKAAGRIAIVDAMSSFGGVPLDFGALGADFVVSSANKCIQGVPGFAFVVARRTALEACAGQARSLCLDLYDQWREMEKHGGKWRYTSPTHVVRAFAQALKELAEEGGPAARYARYGENQRRLVAGMRELEFRPLLPERWHSPIITSFVSPAAPAYEFGR
ncbi:MAG: 2-aminoethylphosphonate--pyruvate transaminase, partial [Desulfovibrionaceae bacterium]